MKRYSAQRSACSRSPGSSGTSDHRPCRRSAAALASARAVAGSASAISRLASEGGLRLGSDRLRRHRRADGLDVDEVGHARPQPAQVNEGLRQVEDGRVPVCRQHTGQDALMLLRDHGVPARCLRNPPEKVCLVRNDVRLQARLGERQAQPRRRSHQERSPRPQALQLLDQGGVRA